jgi:hypothetical protein
MLYLKTPSVSEAWTAVLTFAWVAVVILVATRFLEVLHAVPVFHIDSGIILWEKQHYWIPLANLFGIDGRWPGPFGYNSKTGFIAAAVLVIGLSRYSRTRWILVSIGVITLLLTASRGSYFAAVVGVLVLLAFARTGPASKLAVPIRLVISGVLVLLAGLYYLASPIATTGRYGDGGIWSNFITLWRTSPWLGVGQTGILADPRAGVSMEGHDLFVQHLTRFGLVGLSVQYSLIALGICICALAAYKGLAWPMALVTTYYIASLTEVLQDGWLNHSTYSLLLLLSMVSAGQHLVAQRSVPKLTAQSSGPVIASHRDRLRF